MICLGRTFKIWFIIGSFILLGWVSFEANAPYQFSYPQNFGNHFKVPANNPTTKYGVYLAGFYSMKPGCQQTIAYLAPAVTSSQGLLPTEKR